MKSVIVGAGALGCGFLYPLLEDLALGDISLVDIQCRRLVVNVMQVRENGDVTAREIRKRTVASTEAARVLRQADIVFTATPPSAAMDIARLLNDVPDDAVIVCCENYRDPAGYIRHRTKSKARVVNALANVSAFWVGDERTEVWAGPGELEMVYDLGLDHPSIRQIGNYPDAYFRKMLLHNAPHAVVAYHGWAAGQATIPKALYASWDFPSMWQALLERFPDEIAYIDREMRRFKNAKLPDPVSRVARNPSRKLRAGERLPELYRIVRGTRAEGVVRDAIQYAIRYGRDCDPVVSMWLHTEGIESFVRNYCGLDPFDVLGKHMEEEDDALS